MRIYIYGCSTCGQKARQIRRVREYCNDNGIELEVINTQQDLVARLDHVRYIKESSLEMYGYPAIVVDNDKVTRLSKWTS